MRYKNAERERDITKMAETPIHGQIKRHETNGQRYRQLLQIKRDGQRHRYRGKSGEMEQTDGDTDTHRLREMEQVDANTTTQINQKI